MALVKEKSNPTGAVSKYWIIDKIDINKLSMSARIYVSGYQDRETRVKHPSEGVIERMTYTVPTDDFEVIYDRVILGGDNLYVLAYHYLTAFEKGLPESVEPDPVWWEDANGELSFFADAEPDFEDVL